MTCGLLQVPVNSVVEEALRLFRYNVFFRNFEIKGPADRTLLYALLVVQESLGRIAASRPQQWSHAEALKQLSGWAGSAQLPVPGEAGFSLNAVFPKAEGKQEADVTREYLLKLRVAIVKAVLAKVYGADGKQPADKWWLSFSKRRFMNKSL